MKRFSPVPAPDGWETAGLAAGIAWLREKPTHPDKPRPKDLWSPYRHHLAEGFDELCGYTAMYLPDGHVDHFIPWATLRNTEDAWRAYDWANLRYCVGWLNSSRRGPVPDPFLVDESWFELRLPSLELESTAAVPAAERDAVANVLRWLRKDPRVLRVRQRWYQLYCAGELSLAGLDRMAPLISAALRRQPEFLLPADRDPSRF